MGTLQLIGKIRRLQRLQAEAQAIRQSSRGTSSSDDGLLQLPLIDLIPRLSQGLDRPEHLAPYLDILERAPGGNLRECIAAPPQHGKTVCAGHALVKWLGSPKAKHYAFATYNQNRSDEVARATRQLAEEAGLSPTGTVRQWRVKTGAEVKFTSIGGSLTGYPVDGVLLIDDPVKDREEAESPRMREKAWGWLGDVGKTRVHPGGSILLMATRWHEDDLTGRCVKLLGWGYTNLQAIAEDMPDPLGRQPGEALWPSRRPLDFLEVIRRENAYTWASLYQGRPRPRGGSLFGEPHYYQPSELPTKGYRVGYGLDLAYSAKTHADWSVLVKLVRIGDLVYVVDVLRMQADAPTFLAAARRMVDAEPGPIRWYRSGTEKGVGDFANLPRLEHVAATADKFVRAQPVSAAWNTGKVLVPGGHDRPRWLDGFLTEVTSFTGVHDPHDDIVDALAGGFDVLNSSPAPRATGTQPLGFW